MGILKGRSGPRKRLFNRERFALCKREKQEVKEYTQESLKGACDEIKRWREEQKLHESKDLPICQIGLNTFTASADSPLYLHYRGSILSRRRALLPRRRWVRTKVRAEDWARIDPKENSMHMEGVYSVCKEDELFVVSVDPNFEGKITLWQDGKQGECDLRERREDAWQVAEPIHRKLTEEEMNAAKAEDALDEQERQIENLGENN